VNPKLVTISGANKLGTSVYLTIYVDITFQYIEPFRRGSPVEQRDRQMALATVRPNVVSH